MINLNRYFNFAASEIEWIEVKTIAGSEYPYKIIVHLKSGTSASVAYVNESERNKEREILVKQIENERRLNYERLYSSLCSIENDMKTLNRRQLRIWRQLRDLLGIKVDR